MDVAVCVARAMAVLHGLDPPQVHGSITTSTVFLSDDDFSGPVTAMLDVAAAVLFGDRIPSTARNTQGDLRDFGLLIGELLGSGPDGALPPAAPPALVTLIKACTSERPPKAGYVLRVLRNLSNDAAAYSTPQQTGFLPAAASVLSSAFAAAVAPMGYLSRLVSGITAQPEDPAKGLVVELQHSVTQSPRAVTAVLAALPGQSGWAGFARCGGSEALSKAIQIHASSAAVALGGCLAAEHIPNASLVPVLTRVLKRHAASLDITIAACTALLACASSSWAPAYASLFQPIASTLSSVLRLHSQRPGSDVALHRATELTAALSNLGGPALSGLLESGVVSSLIDAGRSSNVSPELLSGYLGTLYAIAASRGGARLVAVGGALLASQAARGEFSVATDEVECSTVECGLALLVALAGSGDRQACEAAAAVGCIPLVLESGCSDGDKVYAIGGLVRSGQAAAVAKADGCVLALADIVDSPRDVSDSDRGAAAEILEALFAHAVPWRCEWDCAALGERLVSALQSYGASSPRVELACAASLSRLVIDLCKPAAPIAALDCAARAVASLATVVQRNVGEAFTAAPSPALVVASRALARISIAPAMDLGRFVKAGGAKAVAGFLRERDKCARLNGGATAWDPSLATECFEVIRALVSSSESSIINAGIDAGAPEWAVSSAKGLGPGSVGAGLAVAASIVLVAIDVETVDSTLVERISALNTDEILVSALAGYEAAEEPPDWGLGVQVLCTRAIAAVALRSCTSDGYTLSAGIGPVIAARLESVAEELSTALSALRLPNEAECEGTECEGTECDDTSAASDHPADENLQWVALCRAVHALAQKDGPCVEPSSDAVASSESADSSDFPPLQRCSAMGVGGGGAVSRALSLRSRIRIEMPIADVLLLEALSALLARPPDFASAADGGVVSVLRTLPRLPHIPASFAAFSALAECLFRLASHPTFAEYGGLVACAEVLRLAENAAPARAAVHALLLWLGVETGSLKPKRLDSRVADLMERTPLLAQHLFRCVAEFNSDLDLASSACTVLECIAGASHGVRSPAAVLVSALQQHPESFLLALPALSLVSGVVAAWETPLPDGVDDLVRVTVEAMRRFTADSRGLSIAEAGSRVLGRLFKLSSTAIDDLRMTGPVMEVLAGAARVYGANAVVAAACCAILPHVVASAVTPAEGESPPVAQFFESGCCAALSNALHAHSARLPAPSVSGACVALAQLAAVRRRAVLDAGAPYSAVSAIRGQPKSADVAFGALRLLQELFCHGDGCGRTLDNSELSVVCLALDGHAADARVCSPGVALLGHVLDGSSARSKLAVGAGAVTALVAALPRTVSSPDVCSCLKSLRVLSETQPKAVIAAQAPRVIALAVSQCIKTCESRSSREIAAAVGGSRLESATASPLSHTDGDSSERACLTGAETLFALTKNVVDSLANAQVGWAEVLASQQVADLPPFPLPSARHARCGGGSGVSRRNSPLEARSAWGCHGCRSRLAQPQHSRWATFGCRRGGRRGCPRLEAACARRGERGRGCCDRDGAQLPVVGRRASGASRGGRCRFGRPGALLGAGTPRPPLR